MKCLAIKLLSIAAFLVTAAGSPAFALEGEGEVVKPPLPDYYPERYDRKGVLQDIRPRENVITVSATDYVFDVNVQVHSLATEHSSLKALKPGTPIGFNLRSSGGGKAVVSEIWVLSGDPRQWEH